MLNNLSEISICGGYFKEASSFKFFNKEGQKVSIVYGKNGSGKSSIGKAINEYKERCLNQYSDISFFDFDQNAMNFREDIKKSIYVFNEDYISKNININEEGLETIVMFGKEIALDEKISKIEDELGVIEKEDVSLNKIHQEYTDSSNIISPMYHMNIILNRLRGDENWADIDAKIKGNRTKSSVNETIVSNLYNSKSDKKLVDLKQEFNQKMHEFQQASTSEKITSSLTALNINKNIEKEIIQLLSKKLIQPLISDREKIIMKILQDGNQSNIEKAKDIFSKDETKICPFCFQKVNSEYKKSLVESISKVLNKDVDIHIAELQSIKLIKINTDYQSFSILDKKLVDEIEKKSLAYNNLIEKMEEKIKNKVGNVFIPITETSFGLGDLLIEINSLLVKLEEKRKQFNSNIDKVDQIRKELLELNKQIFWIDIKDNYTNFQTQLKKKTDLEAKIAITIEEKNKIIVNLEQIKAEKKNFKIALEIINDYLEYIFFEKSRLSLEAKNDKYYIKSRNNNIKINDLSVGERNVIALCYFFSQFLDNCAEEEAFKEESLIVLDDPISSFDFENKIGIYSFIRSILNKIINNNENSRIIILTHEIEAAYHFEKICKDINCAYKSFLLNNMKLSKFEGKNEYSFLLQQVFKFANKEEDYESLDVSIGNIMRRVLEAYGTFTYKKGIDALSCDPKILKLIASEKHRIYFENLMYRLVLHGESHMEERAKSIPEINFFDFIDTNEKVRTARDILVFLYLLNHVHVESHLNNENAIEQIKLWNSEIA